MTTSHQEPRPTRRRAVSAFAVVAVSGLVAAGAALPSSADAQSPTRDRVQQGLDSLVRTDGFPAALASVRGRDGRVRDYTAGVGDLATKSPVPVNGQVRVASNTKTFVATVVLQLVAEGKVRLDEPVETYLPGIVRGEGIDGNTITVRQLLQHTSGLADYDEVVSDYAAIRHRYFEPREIVDLGLGKPALSAPGAAWSYSNTNYVLLGLLVQKVTGRPIGEEITHRIIDRIGLRDTYWPALGDQGIREPHPHGYFAQTPGAPLADVTEMDPSLGWAAGQLISTPRDLNTFFLALLGGDLLDPERLAEMKKTVAAPKSGVRGDERYGLGLSTFTLSCGVEAWGHGGDAPGYETRNAVTADGRAAAVAVTALPTAIDPAKHVEEAVETALCR
ncbi:serine hydrolase domain-containing protein [Umezawaea endophytica]|uniref:Beta-lactamase family protein n=1 Tax=Umezawaea endophytica TaxID=1654476 RepID=A0A9X2VMT9_9PSEU|nr:serine hydrolase domain-containing protein [Umezawaea endophytica]MCS7479541.1 beta-lactamase family protein [Umezawaea endophytica]